MPLLALLVACSPGLHFRRVAVTGVRPDSATQSTRVSVTFEVWDDDEQLTSLSRESFRVYEDGRPATSESLSEAGTTEARVPVVLLLDTSLSMYQANAVGALKAAAERFVQELSQNGFEVTVYRFASSIEATPSPAAIPDTFVESAGRWTSLYAAVAAGVTRHPEAIVVAFSDGADTYSQNHGVLGLGPVEAYVLPALEGGTGDNRVIHTIGFGNVATERDRQGVPGVQALERLARNGSFSMASDPRALDAVFQDVAERIRNIYVFDYLSPNLSGPHELVIEVQARGRVGRTEPIRFDAGGTSVGGGGCTNTCPHASDGECDDGGPGSLYAICQLGTDCNDCGARPVAGGASGDPGAMERERAAALAARGGGSATTAAPQRDQLRAQLAQGLPPDLQPHVDLIVDGMLCELADAASCGRVPPALAALPEGARAGVVSVLASVQSQTGRLSRVLEDVCAGGATYVCDVIHLPPGGIGAVVTGSAAGGVVEQVLPGGGAQAAGLVVGDIIVGVDGAPVRGLAQQDLVARLRGPVGSTVALELQRQGASQPVRLTVTRQALRP